MSGSSEATIRRALRVAATFEDGVHKLGPFNKKVVVVTRRFDGDEMIWR